MAEELCIILSEHCVKRFQERVAPDLEIGDCWKFLRQNLMKYHKVKVNNRGDGSVYVTYRLDPYRFALICMPKPDVLIAMSVLTRNMGVRSGDA